MSGAGSPICRPGSVQFSFGPLRRFVFKPKYWAICLNMYFFVLFSCLLLHRLAERISLPFYIFHKNRPSYQYGGHIE